MNFQTAATKARKLTPSKVQRDLFNYIRTIETYLADLNVERLFSFSQDIFGNAIGFYSPATEAITGGRKKAGQPFNLFETGEFLELLFAKVGTNSIFFDTKDKKKSLVLRNLLTQDIFGLTDQDLKEAIDSKILPFLLDYFRKQMT